MHNYVYHENKLPVVFSTYFEENKVIHKYNTRQKDDFHIGHCKRYRATGPEWLHQTWLHPQAALWDIPPPNPATLCDRNAQGSKSWHSGSFAKYSDIGLVTISFPACCVVGFPVNSYPNQLVPSQLVPKSTRTQRQPVPKSTRTQYHLIPKPTRTQVNSYPNQTSTTTAQRKPSK